MRVQASFHGVNYGYVNSPSLSRNSTLAYRMIIIPIDRRGAANRLGGFFVKEKLI